MRVLYVEDNATDAELAQTVFANQAPDIQLEIAPTLELARAALAADRFDLLLTDLRLPDGSGLDLLNAVRSDQVPLPVVLVTGQGDLQSAVTALRAGAHDYIVKGDGYLQRLPEVIRRLHQAVRHQELRSRPLRVLYCDPESQHAKRVLRALMDSAPHLQFTLAPSESECRRLLTTGTQAGDEGTFDVVLIQHRPGNLDGLDLVRGLRREMRLTLPIVLAVAEADEEFAARSLHLGVDDFLVESEGFLHALPPTLEKVHRERQLLDEKAALQTLYDRHVQLLASSPTLTYRLHIDGDRRIPVWVSENIERMLGFTPSEALHPDWWWTHVYEDDRERILAAQDDVLDSGELELEYRFRNKAGNVVWIHDRQRLVRKPGSTPDEIVGTWNDVTAETIATQVRAARMDLREMMYGEQALARILERTVEHIEHCFAGCSAAILIADASGTRLVGAAGAVCARFGDLLEHKGYGLMSALQTIENGQAFAAAADRHGEAPAGWAALTAASGHPEGWYQPLPASSGRTPGVLAVFGGSASPLDLRNTKWLLEFALLVSMATKRTEQDLIQRQAFAALANTQDGILITDLKPSILWVNEAWTEITGYPKEESLGRNPSMLQSGLQNPIDRETMWRTLHETGYWQGEVWNRRKNGEIYPQLLRIKTVRDPSGTPTHYVGVMTDLSKLRRTEEEKEHLTHYDPLTQLPNRLLALTRMQHAIEEARRQHHGIALLYLDLDHFKRINDSLGHTTGDRLLAELARRFKTLLRNDTTLARLGGDEFLLIIEHLAVPDDAARLAQRILECLRSPVSVDSQQEIHTGGSIGICIFPDDGDSPQELLQCSETALYEAKNRGRNQYCFYTEGLGERVQQRLRIETQLRLALEREELSLHYQPQVDIRSGLVNGIEALMRWESPALGSVPPSEFIPIAEQSDLIFRLGSWALEEACRQNKRWQDAGLPHLCMAVNVSVRQFKDPNLVPLIRQVLERTGLPPQCLEIELTESAFVDNVEAAIATSRGLHDLGVKLSLDDFGTGYSSLAYLSRFEFDKIKIDQSFVRDITSNPTNAAIANTTIALADSLHIVVLAEGVETESQLDFLRQRGCASMQGYLFSRPLPADEFGALLHEARRLPPPAHAEDLPRTLLLIDDEQNILRALQRLLRQDGYRILATTDPSEAFDLLAQNRIQVVVSDQRMPLMSGTEFLSRVKDLYPETIRIVLSGYSEVDTITQAVNRGAIYRYFSKPWDDVQLREELRDAFRVAERMQRTASPQDGRALPAPD